MYQPCHGLVYNAVHRGWPSTGSPKMRRDQKQKRTYTFEGLRYIIMRPETSEDILINQIQTRSFKIIEEQFGPAKSITKKIFQKRNSTRLETSV